MQAPETVQIPKVARYRMLPQQSALQRPKRQSLVLLVQLRLRKSPAG